MMTNSSWVCELGMTGIKQAKYCVILLFVFVYDMIISRKYFWRG